VLLVTSEGPERVKDLFGERVDVRPTVRPTTRWLRKWFLLHRHYDQLAEAAIADGRSFDLVWANDYPTLFSGVRIARATDAKLIYDTHEIWLATVNQFFPRDVGRLKQVAFRLIVAICRAIGSRQEQKLAQHADAVITANESFAEVFRTRLGRPDVTVVLNCPERSDLLPSDRIRQELEVAPEDRIILYQGLMNPGRGLHELVASARDFPDRTRLVLLGHGMLEPALRRAARDNRVEDRVFFLGPVPQDELHQWTASADLGVLILDPINLSKRLALANKVFEYMAAGIPILATDLPENRRIIERCDCGWLITDWRPETLARHITRILTDPEEMGRRGKNGRHWFESRYNWSVERPRLVAAVETVLAKRGVAGR
jgi:glycosyltransferase involved in cell wall biosynthesis